MAEQTTRKKIRTPHIVGIAILAVGILAVVLIQLLGLGRGSAPRGGSLVTGVVGSEKVAFFEDPRVREIFAERGLDVEVRSSGSWRMAELEGIGENDFAFPASEVAAQHLRSEVPGSTGVYQPFFSPMAIATFEPIMRILEAAGAARQDEDGAWTLDVDAYLALVTDDTRWNEISQGEYDSPRSVMITSTDIRSSNSAGQYLALAAYVANESSVVTSRERADELLPRLTRLFLAQGYSGASSAGPFGDYLSQGISAVPMVMIYEGQFLEEQLAERSRIRPGMVIASLAPTIFSKHTAVTYSDDGAAVMELLENDEDLARLLAEHGFRPTGTHAAVFDELVAEEDLTGYVDTATMVDVAQEPSYEVMDYLLTTIGAQYDVAAGSSVPADDDTAAPATEEDE
ncbi:hypothetical protein GCM10010910_27410 [Microbacterium nanhaiense]|uniref:Extracellular solute-binding protein n=1 Tax=Microbacterium nanhaiense TaxID=1301026 RepID=A0ABQ2N391_9MICO|nr:hypothetical protein [Microbacterium nanhaiense]GGO66904.1 hypothetical protein GCM10010910_27410 [Microbacterium nanhaiense]